MSPVSDKYKSIGFRWSLIYGNLRKCLWVALYSLLLRSASRTRLLSAFRLQSASASCLRYAACCLRLRSVIMLVPANKCTFEAWFKTLRRRNCRFTGVKVDYAFGCTQALGIWNCVCILLLYGLFVSKKGKRHASSRFQFAPALVSSGRDDSAIFFVFLNQTPVFY